MVLTFAPHVHVHFLIILRFVIINFQYNQQLVVVFKSAVCVVDGGSLVEVVKANVARRNEGICDI